MPRTEKRFGVVNQPASTAVEELVPSAATTRNLLINATARSAAVISAAIYSGAFSAEPSGVAALSPGSSSINSSNITTVNSNTNRLISFGKGSSWSNVFSYGTSGETYGLVKINPENLNREYHTQTQADATAERYWRKTFAATIPFKNANAGTVESNAQSPKLNNCYVAVSETKAIGIGANVNTTTSAGYDIFDSVTISHNVGSSFTETGDNVGELNMPGTGETKFAGGAYALQDGVGYLLYSRMQYIKDNTSGRAGLGIYIYSNSSTAFQKRAFWNCDGTAEQTSGRALSYFVASDYNSTHGVFAFSQPSTTTLWSNISPTSSTSFPAGYALPSAAAPAGFRIVSNSDTTEPDVNFLTGAITYPAAPSGIDIPQLSSVSLSQVCSIKFSPEGNRVAIAYSRNYSGTGDTNSVVAVYTRQNDGTWLHTDSSGSAIRYMPNSPDCMAWSPDGGVIAIAATSSTSVGVVTQTDSYFIDLWAVGGGSSSINNSNITSWTPVGSSYPDFGPYLSPLTGTSSVGSVTISGNTITGGSTVSAYSIISSAFLPRGAGLTPTVFATIDGTVTSSAFRQLQGYVLQPSSTVGTSGVPATNYVTMAVSDLSLTQGQTAQVSNIVLESGERLYVGSSTSDSVDISAHGIEST